MKRAAPPPNTAHRLIRTAQWAQAALLRAASWIVQVAGLYAPVERAVARALDPFLDKIAKLVFALIVLHASALLRDTYLLQRKRIRVSRPGGPPRKQHGHHLRTMTGSALRRLARVRDVRGRIAALARMLNEIDALAGRLAKRLARGLSRRRGGFKLEPRAEGHVPFCAQKGYVSLNACDTS